jgi:hypothetical protein
MEMDEEWFVNTAQAAQQKHFHRCAPRLSRDSDCGVHHPELSARGELRSWPK